MELETGDVLQGKIAEVRDWGALVWLGDGKKGTVHISEIAEGSGRNLNIKELIRPNQTVKLKVLKVQADGKIELSIKQAVNLEYTKPPKKKEKASELFSWGFSWGEPPPLIPSEDETKAQARGYDFEQLLKNFKRSSEENLVDLKRNIEANRPGGKKLRRRGRRKTPAS